MVKPLFYYLYIRGVIMNLNTIVNEFNVMSKDGFNSHENRQKYVREYSWSVPCEEALDAIIKFADGGTILEIGSGTGLWAKLLQERGAKIIATDIADNTHGHEKRYCDIENIEAFSAIEKYNDCDVIMYSWPSYGAFWTGCSLATWIGKYFKNKLIYIGESYGGCTGDDRFNSIAGSGQEHCIPLKQWYGLHDELMLIEFSNTAIMKAKKELRDCEEIKNS